MSFLFNNTYHQRCLKSETPSGLSKECQNLWKFDSQTEIKTNHIFNKNGSYLMTCFPKFPPQSSKGWCTTRSPEVDTNTEPDPSKGKLTSRMSFL